jgi:hypothetical protein
MSNTLIRSCPKRSLKLPHTIPLITLVYPITSPTAIVGLSLTRQVINCLIISLALYVVFKFVPLNKLVTLRQKDHIS